MGWQDDEIVGGGGKAAWEMDEIVGPAQQQPVPLITADKQKKKSEMIGPWEAIGEPALNMVTSLGASAYGGLKGALSLPLAGIQGKMSTPEDRDKAIVQAGKYISEAQQDYTYQPRSQAGKTVAGALAWPIEKGTELAGDVGGWVGNQLGDEAMGQALGQGGFQSALALAPLKAGIGRAVPATEAGLLNELGQTVNRGFDKGIRPKGAVKSRSMLMDEQRLRQDAVKSIVEGKEYLKFKDQYGEVSEGRVPQTLDELSQAIEQRKIQTITKANELNKAAGEAGVVVPVESVIGELEKVINNKVMQDNAPEAVRYAQDRLDTYRERGTYTPEEAQEAMKILNESVAVAKKNPTMLTIKNAQIDALIANKMRESLNQSVEGATGPGYADLRREFGALKSIEEPVNKKLKQYNQQNVNSALNFYDVFAASDIIGGALGGNIVSTAKGAGLAGISNLLKKARDPNRAVNKMFRESEGIIEQMKGLMPEEKAAAVVAEFAASPEGQKLLPPGQGFEMREPGDVYSPYSPELAEGVNRLALPPGERGFTMRNPEDVYSPFTPREVGPWEQLYKMAQDPAGRRMLIEKLGKEEKYSGILRKLLDVEPLEALPGVPQKNLLDYSPNTDMNQTQVWRMGDNGHYFDQTQQYQIQPSGFVQQVPAEVLKKQKVYRVGQNALGQ